MRAEAALLPARAKFPKCVFLVHHFFHHSTEKHVLKRVTEGRA